MRKGGKGGNIASKSGADFELVTQDALIKDLVEYGFEIALAVKVDPNSNKYKYINLEKDKNKIEIYFQSHLYKYFFIPRGVNVKNIFSHSLHPDTAIYSERTKTLTIIEKKQQNVGGSVAEKLQTCDYKYYFYSRLCKPLNIEVQIVWQLGSYFEKNKKSLQSVFDYMTNKNNQLFFKNIDITRLSI
jgi:hypothetical protein